MKHWIATGSFLLALAVLLGAMGNHFFVGSLEETGGKDAFFRAHFYLSIHSLGLILIGILKKNERGILPQLPGVLMSLGILLFCGTLFLTSTGLIEFGLMAPFGGISFIGAWIMLGTQELIRKQ